MAVEVSFNRAGLEVVFETEFIAMGITYEHMLQIVDIIQNDMQESNQSLPSKRVIISIDLAEE